MLPRSSRAEAARVWAPTPGAGPSAATHRATATMRPPARERRRSLGEDRPLAMDATDPPAGTGIGARLRGQRRVARPPGGRSGSSQGAARSPELWGPWATRSEPVRLQTGSAHQGAPFELPGPLPHAQRPLAHTLNRCNVPITPFATDAKHLGWDAQHIPTPCRREPHQGAAAHIPPAAESRSRWLDKW